MDLEGLQPAGAFLIAESATFSATCEKRLNFRVALNVPLIAHMSVKRLEDLVAHQFIQRFKLEVYALIHRTDCLRHKYRYVDQLQDAVGDAASDVSEGFKRGRPAEFATFLRYSLSSLSEANTRLLDGIERGYFTQADANEALLWGRRSNDVIGALRGNQIRMAKKWKEQDKARGRIANNRPAKSGRQAKPRSRLSG